MAEASRRVVHDGFGVRLELRRTIAAPRARVWATLTEPALVVGWFGLLTGDPAEGRVQVQMTDERPAGTTLTMVQPRTEPCARPRLRPA